MECPNCGLENPEKSLTCDCGYKFDTGGFDQEVQDAHTQREKERIARSPVWSLIGPGGFIGLVVIIALLSATNQKRPDHRPSSGSQTTSSRQSYTSPPENVSSPYRNDAGWTNAAGHMWSGVKLYFGPKKTYVGEVVCGNNRYYHSHLNKTIRGIKIRYPTGKTEWKDRNAIVSGAWYVKKSDPAIEKMIWYECEY